MSFLSDLGRKVNGVTDGVYATTKEFTGIQSNKKKISKEQDTIEKLYKEIGVAYFNAHCEENDCEFKNLIDGILAARENIDVFNTEISKIQTDSEKRKAEAAALKAAYVEEKRLKAEAAKAEAQAEEFEEVSEETSQEAPLNEWVDACEEVLEEAVPEPESTEETPVVEPAEEAPAAENTEE